jgi:cytochrome bd-type quinol oxidase subunit 1
MEDKKDVSWTKIHADTLAIISVNVAIAAILICLFIMNVNSIQSLNSRVDAANNRSDGIMTRIDSMLNYLTNKEEK